MITNRMTRIQLVLMVVGALVGASALARAEDKPAGAPDLAKGQEELRAELAAVKAELAGVRADLQKVLAQLANMQKANPAQPMQPPPPPKPVQDTTVYDIPVGSSPLLGPKDAKVTVVEFADLQCGFCQKEYPKLQQVLKDYPKDVKLVIKHFPLSMHKQAKPAHAATALATKKGNETFWKMHDLITANPKNMAVEDLRKYAETLGLDLKEFDAVMADEKQQDALLADDLALAQKTGVRGTPTILINGLKMGNRNPEDYKARIDEILKGGDKAEKKEEPKGPQVIELKPAGKP